MAYGVSR